MHFLRASLALVAAHTVAGHSVFTTLFINNVNQGDGTCVRMPKAGDTCTNPIIDLSSKDMACGVDGTSGVARVCPVPQGSKVSFLWRTWADASQPGSIDPSHKGPCTVYMKAVKSAVSDTGTGDGWFKIFDEGYDSTTKQQGLFSVIIPHDLAGGDYLLRPELLALHEADKSPPQPQFYIGCAQIFLQSASTQVPSATVSIPGHVKAGDASVTFNVYQPKFPYPVPGPAPYTGTAAVVVSLAAPALPSQPDGLEPAAFVLKNANWYGLEVSAYNTEAGCNAAGENCWKQASACYAQAPPTGSTNCAIWEAKCVTIQNACAAGSFTGPPNAGKNLSPPETVSYSIPDAISLAIPTAVKTLTVVPVANPTAAPVISTTSSAAAVAISVNDEPSSSTTSIALAIPTLITETLPAIISTPAPASATLPVIISDPAPSVTPLPSIPVSAPLRVSSDASCGGEAGATCLGSDFGDCCSQYNWCGSTRAYCGEKCQAGFGRCGGGWNGWAMRHGGRAAH